MTCHNLCIVRIYVVCNICHGSSGRFKQQSIHIIHANDAHYTLGLNYNATYSIYFQAIDTRVSGLVSGAVSIARFNNDHQLGIMCFTKYVVGDSS